jgi:5-methylcytosine-specific restriction endonuclease McrA
MLRQVTLKELSKQKTKSAGLTLRFKVLLRDKFTCQYCGRRAPSVVVEVDHIIPKSKGGTNDLSNLTASCFQCNRGKRDTVIF